LTEIDDSLKLYSKSAALIRAASNIAVAMGRPDAPDEETALEIYIERTKEAYHKLGQVIPDDITKSYTPKS